MSPANEFWEGATKDVASIVVEDRGVYCYCFLEFVWNTIHQKAAPPAGDGLLLSISRTTLMLQDFLYCPLIILSHVGAKFYLVNAGNSAERGQKMLTWSSLSAGGEAQIIETFSKKRRLGERGADYQGRKRRDSSVDILNKSDRSPSPGSSRSRWWVTSYFSFPHHLQSQRSQRGLHLSWRPSQVMIWRWLAW